MQNTKKGKVKQGLGITLSSQIQLLYLEITLLSRVFMVNSSAIEREVVSLQKLFSTQLVSQCKNMGQLRLQQHKEWAFPGISEPRSFSLARKSKNQEKSVVSNISGKTVYKKYKIMLSQYGLVRLICLLQSINTGRSLIRGTLLRPCIFHCVDVIWSSMAYLFAPEHLRCYILWHYQLRIFYFCHFLGTDSRYFFLPRGFPLENMKWLHVTYFGEPSERFTV